MLTLDSRQIVQIAAEMQVPYSAQQVAFKSISIEMIDEVLLDALLRLAKLLVEPEMLARLAPLIQQEIIIRLLAGPHGPQLQHLATHGSPSQKIAKSVTWLKQNFMQMLQVDDLAARAHMSPSTFRQHFRAITGTSPLQYLKQLRLQEARNLCLVRTLTPATPLAMSVMKVLRSSVASTAVFLARRPSKMSGDCVCIARVVLLRISTPRSCLHFLNFCLGGHERLRFYRITFEPHSIDPICPTP
jgi:AraC-like DNA-binding protein